MKFNVGKVGALPTLLPLGESGLLVRFAGTLSDAANRAAISFARELRRDGMPPGVTEIHPNLVSVLLKYDPRTTDFDRLAGEVRLRLSRSPTEPDGAGEMHAIRVRFGGPEGPDLEAAADALHLEPDAFVRAHNASPLRVLATGFAPGFIYCGFHPDQLRLPRRPAVRRTVPPGSVLFAAGQTAVTSTPIPTGWYVIGRTDFRNFDSQSDPPTRLVEGDRVVFEASP
jgi:KipI family sensor histidine kinase inhibitor